ncbi:MAG: hypothetical protein IKI57_07350 [Clostridia bacterium]|nr:hypothetical protein [Clostridia bacterium]
MKKILCIVLTLILCATVFSCLAEEDEGLFTPNSEPTCYLCRPNVKCRSLENNEEFVTLHFLEEVKILERRGEYTNIEYDDGKTGYVTTGFIVETYYPLIYIGETPVYLSPKPGMTPEEFGYGACGMRYEEIAIVLFEQDGYYFVVTEEGFNGFIDPNAEGLSYYINSNDN